jgi:hypothetical protein
MSGLPFEGYVDASLGHLGIPRLADVLAADGLGVWPADLLEQYAVVAGACWLGPPLRLADGTDGPGVLAAFFWRALVAALLWADDDGLDPERVRTYEWLHAICADEAVGRQFIARIPWGLRDVALNAGAMGWQADGDAYLGLVER